MAEGDREDPNLERPPTPISALNARADPGSGTSLRSSANRRPGELSNARAATPLPLTPEHVRAVDRREQAVAVGRHAQL